LYDSIKEYYVGHFKIKDTIVSTPVFAFVHTVREHIHRQEERLQYLIREQLWPRVQDVLDKCDLDDSNRPLLTPEVARELSLLLRRYDSTFFVPILESMRNEVGANDNDLWTSDTIPHYNTWMRSRNPFSCYVRYHFCEMIIRHYLDQYKKLYQMANQVKEKTNEIQTLEFKTSKKKKSIQKNQSSLHSIRNNMKSAEKIGYVDREISAYTKYIKKIVTTYEKGGEGGAPMPPDVRQSSGGAKQAAIEATLSLEVVPAQAPHFHLCLNSQYFIECFKEGDTPDALEAVKIAHVRRYRAASVRKNRTKVFQSQDDRSSLSKAEMREEEARQSRLYVDEAKKFDKSQAKFFSEQMLANNTIKSRLTYLQEQYKKLEKHAKELQTTFDTQTEAAAKVDLQSAAAAAVQEHAPELDFSSDGVGGESKQQGATDAGEERFEPIYVDDLDLGDDAVSDIIRNRVATLNRLVKNIEKNESKIGSMKDNPKKLKKAIKKLKSNKEKYSKIEAELRELLTKLQESSEK